MNEFGQAIEREMPRLQRYAKALVRDSGHAEELVQSCVARALAKQHLWQPDSDLRAWLCTMLHHLRVNEVRRSAREENYSHVVTLVMTPTSPAPDAGLELRDVARAIHGLPEHQRRVVELVVLEGMGYAAAAARLSVPTGTVRSRLGRARETLRGQLSRPAEPIGR